MGNLLKGNWFTLGPALSGQRAGLNAGSNLMVDLVDLMAGQFR
jgi:hypothetical protein